MPHWIKSTAFAAALGSLALTVAPPAEAQRWHRHHRGSVAAGVAAGIVGGAIVGSLAARPYGYGYGYGYGGYGYPGPGYVYGGAPYAHTYGYDDYGPVYARPYRQFGYVRPGTTGLRSGTVRVSPHYDR